MFCAFITMGPQLYLICSNSESSLYGSGGQTDGQATRVMRPVMWWYSVEGVQSEGGLSVVV